MSLDTTWLDGLLGFKVRRAAHTVAAGYRADGAAHGLRPAHVLILELIDRNRGTTASSIGEVLGIQGPNMASLLKELTERGLVERAPSESDRRAVELGLTSAGRRALRDGRRAIEQHERRLRANLTDAERAQLIGLLDRVIGTDMTS